MVKSTISMPAGIDASGPKRYWFPLAVSGTLRHVDDVDAHGISETSSTSTTNRFLLLRNF